MKVIDPIRIHAPDDVDAARARHVEIVARLDELGRDQVGLMMMSGGFPTGWNTIIHSWLAGGRLAETDGQD